MTFSHLHLKLHGAEEFTQTPQWNKAAETHTQTHTHTPPQTQKKKLNKGKRERERRGRARKRCSEKEREQRREETGTVCQSDAQSCGVHGVTHTTEPSVEATCLIMGNVCIWGRLWLAHAQHGQGKWHPGNYYCIMFASCTHCMHTYCRERIDPTVLLNGLENFGSDLVYELRLW